MWHKMLWPFCNTGHLCGGKGLLLPGPGTTLDLHLGKQYQHHLLQIPPGPAAPAVPAPVSSISKPTTADVGVQAVSSTSNPITADVGVQAGGSFLNFVDKDVDAHVSIHVQRKLPIFWFHFQQQKYQSFFFPQHACQHCYFEKIRYHALQV